MPGSMDMDRARDLRGRTSVVWSRWVVMVVFLAIAVFALLNGIGQRATTARTSAPAAELSVHSPTRVRGGLLFQARITIRAHKAIQEPKLVLSSGWFDGLTINTIEPSPGQEANRNGEVALSFNQLPAGQVMHVYMEFQANPTTVGKKKQDLELDDGGTVLATVKRTLTVFP